MEGPKISVKKRYTAIALVNELHFLALQQRRATWAGKDSLPITRLVGKKIKKTACIGDVDLEPYEKCVENVIRQYEINYNFLNPEHGFIDLSKYSNTWEKRQIGYVPIGYMQIQLDLYPKENYIYRLDFYRREIPEKSETLAQRKILLDYYLKSNGLYQKTDPRALAKPYCLELNRITKAPRTACNAFWKKPADTTEKYLKTYGEETEDFFPLLQSLVGDPIQWAYKYYNEKSVGWQLDGIVAPMKIGGISR